MKDLYKRLNLPKSDCLPAHIKSAVEMYEGNPITRAEATHVLLVPDRRAIYDRDRQAVMDVAYLRSKTGLVKGPRWNAAAHEDFRYKPEVAEVVRETLLKHWTLRDLISSRRRERLWQIRLTADRIFRRLLLVGLCLCIGIGALSAYSPAFLKQATQVLSSVSSQSTVSKPGASSTHTEVKAQKPAAAPFTAPPVPLPANNEWYKYDQREGVAPLTISTRYGEGNHCVKVVDHYTKQLIAMVFVRDGQQATIRVPVGSAELRYATGSTWYGYERLFGPDTRYSRADTVFNFRLENGYYKGYTVELYLQHNGNMSTSEISASDF